MFQELILIIFRAISYPSVACPSRLLPSFSFQSLGFRFLISAIFLPCHPIRSVLSPLDAHSSLQYPLPLSSLDKPYPLSYSNSSHSFSKWQALIHYSQSGWTSPLEDKVLGLVWTSSDSIDIHHQYIVNLSLSLQLLG